MVLRKSLQKTHSQQQITEMEYLTAITYIFTLQKRRKCTYFMLNINKSKGKIQAKTATSNLK